MHKAWPARTWRAAPEPRCAAPGRRSRTPRRHLARCGRRRFRSRTTRTSPRDTRRGRRRRVGAWSSRPRRERLATYCPSSRRSRPLRVHRPAWWVATRLPGNSRPGTPRSRPKSRPRRGRTRAHSWCCTPCTSTDLNRSAAHSVRPCSTCDIHRSVRWRSASTRAGIARSTRWKCPAVPSWRPRLARLPSSTGPLPSRSLRVPLPARKTPRPIRLRLCSAVLT